MFIVAELPKTRSGKIMRRLLRDVAEHRELGDTTTLTDAGVMATITGRLAGGRRRRGRAEFRHDRTTPTRRTHELGRRGADQSIGGLVSNVTSNVSSLVRLELELAKTELSAQAKEGAAGLALFLVAAALMMMVLVLASFAAAYGFARMMPVWAAFLTVAGIYLVIAALLAFIGSRRLKKVKGPERAKAQIDLTKETFVRRSEAAAQAKAEHDAAVG